LEEAVATLGNLLWIVDLNRQSLDRITPDARRRQLAQMFAANGWRVIELRWGHRLRALFGAPGGDRLRRRLESMPSAEYHALLRSSPSAVRKRLAAASHGIDEAIDRLLGDLPDEDVQTVIADVGGHDLGDILDALDEADRRRDQPCVILADTIKG